MVYFEYIIGKQAIFAEIQPKKFRKSLKIINSPSYIDLKASPVYRHTIPHTIVSLYGRSGLEIRSRSGLNMIVFGFLDC